MLLQEPGEEFSRKKKLAVQSLVAESTWLCPTNSKEVHVASVEGTRGLACEP